MHESNSKIEAKVLSLLNIHDINDSEAAFQTIVDALSTISKALGNCSLRAVLSSEGFSHIRSLRSLSPDEFGFLNKLVEERKESLSENSINDSQVLVQKLIRSPMRKRLAAYYTKASGLELMAESARDFVKRKRAPVTLADPFLGSGLTLSTTLKHLDSSNVGRIWGIEPHPLSALVAYSAILYYLNGDQKKIDIAVGDAFADIYHGLHKSSAAPSERRTDRESPRADLIVTNPPFTRWELLGEDYRNSLWNCVESLGYYKYVTRRQLNLQVASLFLMDHLLERNGLLASVLPASTFYTLYGEAARSLLAERYQIDALIESESDTSFSIDSGLKEVILLATKGEPTHKSRTAFARLEPKDIGHMRQVVEALNSHDSEGNGIAWIDLKEKSILAQADWSIFFADAKLREAISAIFSEAIRNGTIGKWETIYGQQSIVRGVEMYGPDFFFIPNRYWCITEEDGPAVTIKNFEDESRLTLPKDYLILALRKPSLYLDTIRPSVKHYLLSIPPWPVKEFPADLASYIDWGKRKSTGQPAIRLYGDLWYSHVNKQLRVKKPFGRVFLPDKVDPTFRNRGLFASYSQRPLVASKNFHIMSLNDDRKEKALVAWFNSTLFISYFILAGRRITKRWSRFLEDDYLRMPVVNVNLLDGGMLSELEDWLGEVSEMKLPPIKTQLGSDYRMKVDRTLLEALCVTEPDNALNQLYFALSHEQLVS
jgi:type I restriction-modification system DNA methylase subunit